MTVEDRSPSNGNQCPFADFKTSPSSPHLGLGFVFMKKSTATWTMQDELFNESLEFMLTSVGTSANSPFTLRVTVRFFDKFHCRKLNIIV